ncbi:RICIN domain-containing protein [Kitasatospora cineracea]
MSTPLRRTLATAAAAALACLAAGLPAPASAAASPPDSAYTVGVSAPVPFGHPTDTPAVPYLDKDGTFYYQQSAALYGANDPRRWDFYTGADFDGAAFSSTLGNSADPADPKDRNSDTTQRCNNSPTGLTASYAPAGSSYAQKNYCDLSGIWIDPDTGDWYGLVHNEFSPQPFGDGLHFDAIDYAVSTDQGRTWKIRDHVVTSPYRTARGDTAQFPNQTYYYGDGDQRLLVDTASGYFYLFYGSRVVDKSGGWKAFHEHVARAPISGKMAPGSWQKWYDGAWGEPGVGGRESSMVPVGPSGGTGYVPPSGEYDPASTGTSAQQIAAGKMPATSPLFVMDVTYDAYLGLYVGEPQAVDQSGNAPQQYYVTDDLSTQKWYLAGDTGGYRTASWYRWFLDGGNRTSSQIVGRTFRSYCSFGCSNGASGEYVNTTLTSTAAAPAPVDVTRAYRIAGGDGRVLAQVAGSAGTTSLPAATGSALESWTFAAVGDGSYRIANSATGQLLGVDSTGTAGRAWGARPTATAAPADGPTVGQQWWVLRSGSAYHLVNRYSGLDLALSAAAGRPAETVPTRTWTDTSGSAVGGGRTAAEQTLALTPVGTAAEVVTVTAPGRQSGTVGTAVSLQLSGTDSLGKALTWSATGLPAGLSVSPAGLVTGTPTAVGAATVTATASSGTATGSTAFTWAVNPVLGGSHTLLAAGKALDDPGHSTSAGTQFVVWTPNGGPNQSWVFTRQGDGSYQIANGESKLCVDVSGGSTAPGAAVIQWTCTGGANQRWLVDAVSGGGYTVTSRSSGLLLTAGSTADGAPVTQQADTGSALQHWSVG